ncbi:unnamed protein product [Prorocentrum cordatum]|uniref:Acyltransferase 3 domain-containing protein n=1 Tax=Prorocentrum cordatum TaxID=2364126 RepID=A0ABN9TD51_9DINO|nr:unnamed protein product [Polarella glacialis]
MGSCVEAFIPHGDHVDDVVNEDAGENGSLTISKDRETLAHIGYRSDVDGLRAVAVLSVIAYHMNTRWLPGGYAGVDIFFVISGCVVTASLLNHSCGSCSEFFCGFYARRVKRLTPALLISTASCGLYIAIMVPPMTPHLEDNFAAAASALCGASNVFFARLSQATGDGYWDEMTGQSRNAANPFVHTWSLGVEEHFYLVFPLLVLLAHGCRVVASAGCRPPWPASLIIFGASAVLSGCASRVMTVHVPDMAFYLLPARFWELAVGAILADAHAAGRLDMTADGRSAAVVGAQDLVATLLIASSLVLDTVGVGFPFPGALLPVAGAACVIMAGRCESSALRRVLGQELPVYIGKLSYPLYLWHWPVLKFAEGTVLDDMPVAWRYLLLLSVMLALASATYHAVEGPFRSWRPKAHWHAFAMLLPAAVVLAGCMLALRGPLFGKLSVSAGNSEVPSATMASTSSSPGEHVHLEQLAPASHDLALTACACGRVPEFTHAPATANDGRDGQPSCLDMSGGSELNKSCWAVYHRCSGDEWCDNACESPGKNCTQEKRMDEALIELFDRKKRQCLSPATGAQRKPTIFLLGDSHALFFKHALTQAVRSADLMCVRGRASTSSMASGTPILIPREDIQVRGIIPSFGS